MQQSECGTADQEARDVSPIESTAIIIAVTIALFAWNRLPVIVVAFAVDR